MSMRTPTREVGRIEALDGGGEWIGYGRRIRRTYSLDEIALVPAASTLDPEDVDGSWQVGGHTFRLPFVAAAMDSVVDVRVAGILSALGGLAVLNLEGLQTRYPDPADALAAIAEAPAESVVPVMQRLYRAPSRTPVRSAVSR
jgi:IMP dehydrogenase